MAPSAHSVLHIHDYHIPLQFEKLVDRHGISGATHCADCLTKSYDGAPHRCGSCGGEDTVIGKFVLDEFIVIDSAFRREFLGSESDMVVISSHKLSSLVPEIIRGSIISLQSYKAEVICTGHEVDDVFTEYYQALLSKLSTRKMFLLVRLGISGIERYAIILPNGVVMSLAYIEETRDFPGTFRSTFRGLSEIQDFLDEMLEDDFPALSSESLLRKLRTFRNKINPKKEKGRVKVR